MIERKEKHLAQYTRPIIDDELTDLGHDYHLSVMSLLPSGEEAEKG